MLKNANYLEKDVKKSTQRRVVTPACYYDFVKFISSTKCGLLPSKKNKFCIF